MILVSTRLSASGSGKAVDCYGKLVLHSTANVFKSVLRPTSVSAQDKSPAEKLSRKLTYISWLVKYLNNYLCKSKITIDVKKKKNNNRALYVERVFQISSMSGCVCDFFFFFFTVYSVVWF